MRYLVLIPTSDGPLEEITYRELQSAREVRDGDMIVLDEIPMRVRAVISPDGDQYDGQIICRPHAE